MEGSYRDLSIFFNMDVFWFTLVLIFFIFFMQKCWQKQKRKLPPSPPALPILGHLHLLKASIHRALLQLSNKYGPIVYLHFGNRPTLVVSSPSIAEDCFTKNDIIFANRPGSIAIDLLSYDRTTMGALPYGDHWRNLRRVNVIHIFSPNAINQFSAVRLQEIRFILQKLFSSSNETRKANLNSLFMELVFNIITKMVSGKRWSDQPYDMFDADIPVGLSDFIPILRWIDYGGFEKKFQEIHKKRDMFLQDLIDEIRAIDRNSLSSKHHKTVIRSLLSLQEADPEYYTDDIIKGNILMLFTAGTETSASTMEWAMSLLLNHADVMEKLRSEIEHHVPPERLVEDSDLSKLPYLRCVINETLRLFPVAPLLLPHTSSEDCTIGGYNVARGTTLMVNAWAIHRDPNVWEEPTKFKPERFEGFRTENEGFKFLPFGMGRRACPGNGMAIRLVSLTLATLIQCFEWERIGPELVDLEEGSGFTLAKAKPLEAVYRPRPSMSSLLSQL